MKKIRKIKKESYRESKKLRQKITKSWNKNKITKNVEDQNVSKYQISEREKSKIKKIENKVMKNLKIIKNQKLQKQGFCHTN